VGHTIVLAKRTPHTVRGTLVLAFGHDGGVGPNAALGMLDPLVARVAMSLLVVVAGMRPGGFHAAGRGDYLP
jgi:cation transport ATPase